MSGQVRLTLLRSNLSACSYARLQSVLTPTGTLIVGYTNELIQELNNVLRDTPGRQVYQTF